MSTATSQTPVSELGIRAYSDGGGSDERVNTGSQ